MQLLEYVYADGQATIPATAPSFSMGFDSLPGLFNLILNLVIGIGIALAVIFLVIGGIKYITSGGDQKATAEARTMLTNAVIGFVIVIAALTLKTILGSALGSDAAVTEVTDL